MRMDVDGYSQVDPFQDLLAGRDIQYGPDPGTIGRSHTFEVYAVAGRNITLLVDDEVLVTTVEGADGDQQRVTGTPLDALAPGTHAFTVVVELDGAVQARSVLYTVTD